ncbi:MAG: CDP-diacylglycerol diphosphatase [Pseudomonadota bacterium]|nr:CDP-diacylglycerol diphosphatase [Pseudomonadota bacterium]
MSASIRSVLIATVAAAAWSGAAAQTHEQKSADLPLPAGRDALRQIVQTQCVVGWNQHHDPTPCQRVVQSTAKSGNSGYAVLADRKGGAHFLLIPIQTMAGTDAAELLDPDLPNFFAEAWNARGVLSNFVGHEVPRADVGLAVNTAGARTQNQFHIHIECLRTDVLASLHVAADRLTEVWTPIDVAGSQYQAMRISGSDLNGANPFELLAALGPEVRRHMGDYTLLVAGMQYKTGAGFALLTGTGPTGELLLDSSCSASAGG